MRKRRRFMVGYDHDRNPIWGTTDLKALTLAEAKRRKPEMYIPSKAVIYELVPVKPKKKEKK